MGNGQQLITKWENNSIKGSLPSAERVVLYSVEFDPSLDRILLAELQ